MANPVPSADDLALGEEPEQPVVAPEPEEPETPEVPVAEEPEAPAEEPEAPEEPETPPTPRESKRIQQVLNKLKESQNQLPQPKTQDKNPDGPIIGEGEYDIDEINRLAKEEADRRYAEGLRGSDERTAQIQNALTFQTRLELDAPKIAAKYEFLNSESDGFDPGAASFINEMFLKTVGYDPQNGTVQNSNIRYDEFVEGIVELRETLATAKTADSQANIAAQVAKTGLRPGGGTVKAYSGDDPSKMSDAQLEAEISAGLASLPRRR